MISSPFSCSLAFSSSPCSSLSLPYSPESAAVVDLGKRTRDFLVCLVQYGVGLLLFGLVEIANEIMAIFGFLVNSPSLIIPGLDFTPPTIPTEVLGWINWIFPLQLLAPLFTAVLSAAAVLRVMRWWAALKGIPIRPID